METLYSIMCVYNHKTWKRTCFVCDMATGPPLKQCKHVVQQCKHSLVVYIWMYVLIIDHLTHDSLNIYEHTVLSRFLAHTLLSEHAPLTEYRSIEVNCNIFNIGTPAFSINSQTAVFQLRRMYQKAWLQVITTENKRIVFLWTKVCLSILYYVS